MLIVFLLFLTGLTKTACTGNECSAVSTVITDQDSDCIEDSADNCVGFYNPDQFDGDEDGVGEACDVDDTDDSIALTVDEWEESQ